MSEHENERLRDQISQLSQQVAVARAEHAATDRLLQEMRGDVKTLLADAAARHAERARAGTVSHETHSWGRMIASVIVIGIATAIWTGVIALIKGELGGGR